MGEGYNFYNFMFSYSDNILEYIILPVKLLLCLKVLFA